MKSSSVLGFLICAFYLIGCNFNALATDEDWSTPNLNALDNIAISKLRARSYNGKFNLLEQVNNNSSGYTTHMVSYLSDGLLVYARVDIPEGEVPASGYPVLLYSHGWVGIEKAPDFNFFLDQNGSQAQYINRFAQNGYVVITPGWKGHGSINGIRAHGKEFMDWWDNASYLSPVFYSLDMLNALEAVKSINNWSDKTLVNTERVFLSGHSQGGDVALLTLAIAGEKSSVRQELRGASIFSGCIVPRLKQGELYGSMATTPEAFLAGDGSWQRSAVSPSGEINNNFQFAFPPDWVGTPNKADWSWQNGVWKYPTVKQAVKVKYDEMYDVLSQNGIHAIPYQLMEDEPGTVELVHSKTIMTAYYNTSAINFPQWLTEPLALHHSDRDYYSPPYWNQLLENKLIENGNTVSRKEYKGNTHSLTISEHKWFSENHTKAGIELMIEYDLNFFDQL